VKGIHKTGRGRSEQHKDHDTSLLFIKPRPCSLKGRTTYEQRVPTIQDAASAVIYDGREVPVDWLERGVQEMGDHSGAARNEEQNPDGGNLVRVAI
jgi:hypothetical protein